MSVSDRMLGALGGVLGALTGPISRVLMGPWSELITKEYLCQMTATFIPNTAQRSFGPLISRHVFSQFWAKLGLIHTPVTGLTHRLCVEATYQE